MYDEIIADLENIDNLLLEEEYDGAREVLDSLIITLLFKKMNEEATK